MTAEWRLSPQEYKRELLCALIAPDVYFYCQWCLNVHRDLGKDICPYCNNWLQVIRSKFAGDKITQIIKNIDDGVIIF